MPAARKPARITIFNHKGGVGKTTLTVNIAAALADRGMSVLLMDTDPQCNLTSYLLEDSVVDDLLSNSEGPNGATIWSALKPIVDGARTMSSLKPQQIGRLSLVPGDIRLSEFEEFLSEAWTDCFRRRAGALRATAAISGLVDSLSDGIKPDFVFYDTGPNIGPLNRVLLLDSDFFVVPVACDLFSVRALSTLGQALKRWVVDYETIASLAPDGAALLPGVPKLLGYLPQRFRVYGHVMAQKPAHYLRTIHSQIHSQLVSVLSKVNKQLCPPNAGTALGEVRDFGSLAQLSQQEGVPLWDCSSTYSAQKLEAKKAFHAIADRILHLTQSGTRRRTSS